MCMSVANQPSGSGPESRAGPAKHSDTSELRVHIGIRAQSSRRIMLVCQFSVSHVSLELFVLAFA